MDLNEHISENQQHEPESGHAALWRVWQKDGDASVREQLIEAYLPFARMLAAKMFARRTYMELEFHDYFQHASIGLIEAVDKFDRQKGVKFEAYAATRINGAILSGIETLSEKQEQVSARKRILASRVDSLKDVKTDHSDPEALFASLAELAIGLAMGLVLEDSGMYQGAGTSYADNTYQRIELQQLQSRVVEAVQRLRGNERRVISYHYLQHLAFDEIASILGLSKGRVSQIHKAALQRLREDLGRGGGVDLIC